MDHWSTEIEHEALTDDNREAFNTSMSKYATQGDALMGGFNAMKLTGKPFRMPESLDKLPDDDTRAEFSTRARELLGMTHVNSLDELEDLDLRAGANEGTEVDEDFAKGFKQIVLDEKIPKAQAQALLKWYNGYADTAIAGHKAKMEADNEAMIAEQTAKATSVQQTLATEFGGKEELGKQQALLDRAVQALMSPEKYEATGKNWAEQVTKQNVALGRAMLKGLSPRTAESSLKGPGIGNTPAPQIDPDAGSPTYVALGYSTKEEAAEYNKRNAT